MAGDALGRPRRLGWAVVSALGLLSLATVVGIIVLWPAERPPRVESGEFVTATVEATGACPDIPVEDCALAEVTVTSGQDAGEVFVAGAPLGAGAPVVVAGDKVVLQSNIDAPPDQRYAIVDFQRGPVLWGLAAVFAVAVVLLARWRGVAALAGLVSSLGILMVFVLPAILGGAPPLWVAVVGGSAIALVTMPLAHGVSLRTGVALLSTLTTLLLIALLGDIAIRIGSFTGLANESSSILQAYQATVDPRGLLLAGLVIGALGVLDDVTITQTAAVSEVKRADPSLARRHLMASGLRVGRDHVAATVNTLVLAYAGAALPLLLLFTLSGSDLGQILTGELVAQEVVRTLVGAIGIVAAVPLSTALAAALLAADPAQPNTRARSRTSPRLGAAYPRGSGEQVDNDPA
jgi:uncharacterized membrane protein